MPCHTHTGTLADDSICLLLLYYCLLIHGVTSTQTASAILFCNTTEPRVTASLSFSEVSSSSLSLIVLPPSPTPHPPRAYPDRSPWPAHHRPQNTCHHRPCFVFRPTHRRFDGSGDIVHLLRRLFVILCPLSPVFPFVLVSF